MLRVFLIVPMILAPLGAFARGAVPGPGSGKVLVHMVLTEEDPDLAGTPGEQALVHRLYVVDLSSQQILGQTTLGTYAHVVLADRGRSAWVAQRHGADQNQTRVREFDLPDFQTRTDFAAPLILNAATDPEGRFATDRQIAVLGRDHIILVGSPPGGAPGERNLVSVDISRKGSSVQTLTTLSGLHIDLAGVLNLDARRALALFGQGDGLLIKQKGRNVTTELSTGLSPLTLDAEVNERVELADSVNGVVVAVTTKGIVLKGVPGAQNTTSSNPGAAAPEHLSIDPKGVVAAIRHRTDVENNVNEVAVVRLDSTDFASATLPSDGAVLQLDATRTLYADGIILHQLDTTDPNNPTRQEVFRFTGVPVQRILKILPLRH